MPDTPFTDSVPVPESLDDSRRVSGTIVDVFAVGPPATCCFGSSTTTLKK